MFLIFCLISIYFNCLTSGELIVSESSESVVENFLSFNIETDVAPSRYDIVIDLDEQLDFQYFNGTSTIRFVSRVNSEVLVFHFQKSSLNKIYAIRLTNVDHNENLDFETATSFRHNDDAMIGLKLDDGLILQKNNSYDLYVEYMVKFSDKVSTGFFKTCAPIGENDKSCYVTTHFESIHFRETVPSFDVISLKSQFNIKIIHNGDLMAMSNMPGTIIQRVGNLTTTQFEETPLMSTYIVAFTVGKFKTIPVENLSNISMNVYIHDAATAGSKAMQTYPGKLLFSLENYLNLSYTLPKLDFLITRTTSRHLKGMENWGLITLDENTIFEDTQIPCVIFDIGAIEIIAHEIVHLFFGNLVTMQNISYLWLNEGFATYFSYRLMADILPRENFHEQLFSHDTAITQYVETMLPITILNDFQPYAVPNRKLYVYTKGSIIVNVLSHALGESAFQTVMQMYIKKFSYGLVTPNDLIDIIEEANHVHHRIPSDVNIKEFIMSWINQNRYPILTVTRNYTTGDVLISQTAFKIRKFESNKIWWIPFNYATKSKPNFWNTLPDGWLRNGSMTLPLNLSADDWIIFNKQQSGNYIVNYDEENWRLITEAMRTDNFEIIPSLERARAISDAHILSHIAKMTNKSIFFDLLPILKNDRSHVTWNVIYRIIKIYSTDDIVTYMQVNKLNYFTPAYDSLGFEHLDDDSRQKRVTKIIVTNLACFLRYDRCLNDMNKLSEEYLKSIENDDPLVLDRSILMNLFEFGFSRDAAFEQISMYVHNSSNRALMELFYSQSAAYTTRIQFQLHYMLTIHNLTLNSEYRRPAIVYDNEMLATLNDYDMFSLCLISNCYDFNGNSRTIEERNELIYTVVVHVIRKAERNIVKINQLYDKVETAYNVKLNHSLIANRI